MIQIGKIRRCCRGIYRVRVESSRIRELGYFTMGANGARPSQQAATYWGLYTLGFNKCNR